MPKTRTSLTKKEIIGSVLISELCLYNIDSFWKVMSLKQKQDITKEGATGDFLNKGAIFMPGGMIYCNSRGKEITYDHEFHSIKEFKKKIKKALIFDNATLIIPNKMSFNNNLDNSFFLQNSPKIYDLKKAVTSKKNFINITQLNFDAEHIARTYSPPKVENIYGAKTLLTTSIAESIRNPHILAFSTQEQYNILNGSKKDFKENFRQSQYPITLEDKIIANPHIISCHTSIIDPRGKTGLIKIMGYGNFGEFATITIEEYTDKLKSEINNTKFEGGIIAEHNNCAYSLVLRIYPKVSKPGRRTKDLTSSILTLEDLNIAYDEIQQIEKDSKERYF